MNQSQNNRFEMQKSTDLYIGQNQPIWDAIPVVHNYKQKLSEINASIEETALRQEAAQVFIGKSQIDTKKSIAEFMAYTDDSLEVYAQETGDVELLSQAANSVSDYYRLPNEDFELKVKNMIEILEVNLPKMIEYGFSENELNDLKEEFNSFQEKRGKPRAYKISSRIATQDLKGLFDEAADVLNKMDKILRRFKLKNPSFYNGYIAARLVVNK